MAKALASGLPPAGSPSRESPEGSTEVGVLTDSMVRLRDEIVSSRRARVALRGDLVCQTDERRTRVSTLCDGFARDRAGAHRAWFGTTLAERQAAERPQQRRLVEEARANVREKQRRLVKEAAAKARAEEPPAAPPKAEPQRHEPVNAVSAAHTRPPVPPLPHAHKPPFKGSKKRSTGSCQ